MEDGGKILLARAFNYHKILNEEAISHVPSLMKNSTRWIEKIAQLLVVDLEEGGLHIELLGPHSHPLPHISHCSREEAVIAVI
jgi:hypothetical protein